ncbi:enoyl-CoA hydratase/isomerase family protein [Vibrio sinensis]|uniref:3-hydroxyisobutyryl-CoA hydrolase n=1 Tax=Vibrio sinensis TaxID=2302434 RepID=A0A3A6QVT5_9VIBR|nr:enoyl-CoA hydratase/isomerase family protein [Vibrio sinensis]RJX75408.1 enoyl-CoA hydratase/isomerase family protein [Vibrio sinensis]
MDQVTFQQLGCSDNKHQIGIATLDNTSSLNALTFNMLSQLMDKLLEWQDDESIVCVFLQGAGEKAFCAGGDVRTMYHVMNERDPQESRAFFTDFFTTEYQCDYLIHTYQKPIIGWGDRIVMGGGLGLFAGTSHRVVTPHSRLAMPEIHIGLYPDVGGTYFLNQLPPGIGLFLGLTATPVNASDALDLTLSDYLLLREHRSTVLEQLQVSDWNNDVDSCDIVSDLLETLSYEAVSQRPDSQLLPYLSQIQSACHGEDLTSICRNIQEIKGDEAWLEQAKKSLTGGSPISAYICYRQITQCHDFSLADCFRVELSLSVRCALLGEFQEGVRSRLIDKDNQPEWMFGSVSSVDESIIDTLFTSLWTRDNHPLAGLSNNVRHLSRK